MSTKIITDYNMKKENKQILLNQEMEVFIKYV